MCRDWLVSDEDVGRNRFMSQISFSPMQERRKTLWAADVEVISD